ncbi:beta-glucuronosyltransferase GlcAT14B-like isoform X2 [Macadamia integrifolia]|uniref:beta-glucuronosyltransferase GlcAT14B-like isoform X2 n=1 Tax=Macadamia integrifolia TaxID=60698 RepID=UPI001C4EBD98|nr:beta-glucuronosyltransferase GlcAT14B-like isoform X2 [Macadamia integrifolia]
MSKTAPKLLLSLVSVSLFSLLLFVRPNHRASSSPRSFSRTAGLENPFPPPPRVAYFISGSEGDGPRILRLLHAVYHPRNQYLLHLDRRARQRQREDLAVSVQSVQAFVAADNVNVVGRGDSVNREGSTPVASLLHGAAILLRFSNQWDWFINLEASDYPLIPQDDFLHVLSFVPTDFNFIQHTSNIGWKEYQRIIPIVVDPGLYLESKGELFLGSEKRILPTAYRFFTGSPYVILSRKFVEFSIMGWDNLPRTLLMYFSNTKSSHRGYFQTLACNSRAFVKTVVNSNLHFIAWDNPPRKEPRNLWMSDLNKMLGSGAPFAGSFRPNDPVLDRIDSFVLHRGRGRTAPGGWCIGGHERGRDPCQLWGDVNILKPSKSAKRFEKLLLRLMANTTFWSNLCAQRWRITG